MASLKAIGQGYGLVARNCVPASESADLNHKLLTHGSAEILITLGRQDKGTSATHHVVSIPRFKVVAPVRVGEHWWRVRGRRVLAESSVSAFRLGKLSWIVTSLGNCPCCAICHSTIPSRSMPTGATTSPPDHPSLSNGSCARSPGHEKNNVEKLTLGSTIKWALAVNASRDPELLGYLKTSLPHQPDDVEVPLQEIIESCETFEPAHIRKQATDSIEELRRKGSEASRNFAWWGQAGQTALSLGCVARPWGAKPLPRFPVSSAARCRPLD